MSSLFILADFPFNFCHGWLSLFVLAVTIFSQKLNGESAKMNNDDICLPLCLFVLGMVYICGICICIHICGIYVWYMVHTRDEGRKG